MLTLSPYRVSPMDVMAPVVRRHKRRAAAQRYEEYKAATETEIAFAKVMKECSAKRVIMYAHAAVNTMA